MRQYILGSVLLPAAFTLIWYCILGGNAMWDEVHEIVPMWKALEGNLGAGIFVMLSTLPGAKLFSFTVMISLMLFLITTADSASILCSMMVTKNGYQPSIPMRVFWGSMIGVTGMILLVAGGLASVQSASTIAALPLSFIVLLANISFILALRKYEFRHGNAGIITPYEQFSEIRADIEYLYPGYQSILKKEMTEKGD